MVYRSDVQGPVYSVNAMAESETGSMGMGFPLPSTPDNSVTTGVNAGPLEIPSDQPITQEAACDITNPGPDGGM